MNTIFLIGLMVILCSVVSIVLFIQKHRKEVISFLATMKELTSLIEQHKSQIRIREKHLNRYSFLKYNLKEVLNIQIDIKL